MQIAHEKVKYKYFLFHGDTVLLSRGTAERMGLVKYHLDLTTSTPLPIMGETWQVTVDLVEEYKDVISGLGKLRGVKLKLHVDPDAKGAVQKQRRIYQRQI